jgi:hypothetical protein
MKNNSYKQQNVHYSTRHDAAAYILASIVKQVQEYPCGNTLQPFCVAEAKEEDYDYL